MANYWTSSLQNGVPAGSVFGIPLVECQSCNQVFANNEAFESHMVQAVLSSSRRNYPSSHVSSHKGSIPNLNCYPTSSPTSTPKMVAQSLENMISPENDKTFQAALQPMMPSPPQKIRKNFSAVPLSLLPQQHAPPTSSLMELSSVQSPPPIIPEFFRRMMVASRIGDDGTQEDISLLEKPIMKIQASEVHEPMDLTLKLNSLEQ